MLGMSYSLASVWHWLSMDAPPHPTSIMLPVSSRIVPHPREATSSTGVKRPQTEASSVAYLFMLSFNAESAAHL